MKTDRRSQWAICLVAVLLLVSTTVDAYGDLEEQPVPPPRKNAMELEVAGVSLGLSYARWTWGSYFLGVGTGLGATFVIDNLGTDQTKPHFEIAHLRGFISRRTFSWLTIDAGPHLTVLGYNGDDWVGAVLLMGGEVTALVGWRRIKFGPSVQAGWVSGDLKWHKEITYVALTPMTMRLTLDW